MSDMRPIDPNTSSLLLFQNRDVDMALVEEKIKTAFGADAFMSMDRSHPTVTSFAVLLNGLEFWCSHLSFPVPADEIKMTDAVKVNLMTAEENQAFCDHQSFFIIAQKNGGTDLANKRQVCCVMSLLCGALLELKGSVGVCRTWSGLLVSTSEYLRHVNILKVETGRNPDYFPTSLWVLFYVFMRGESNVLVGTRGLTEFGFSELQLNNPTQPPTQVFSLLQFMISSQITGRSVYKDQDMISLQGKNGEQVEAVFKEAGDGLAVFLR